MSVALIGKLEVSDSIVKCSQVLETQGFVEVYFPVIFAKVDAFIKDFNGSSVPTKQVQRVAELLQVVHVGGV